MSKAKPDTNPVTVLGKIESFVGQLSQIKGSIVNRINDLHFIKYCIYQEDKRPNFVSFPLQKLQKIYEVIMLSGLNILPSDNDHSSASIYIQLEDSQRSIASLAKYMEQKQLIEAFNELFEYNEEYEKKAKIIGDERLFSEKSVLEFMQSITLTICGTQNEKISKIIETISELSEQLKDNNTLTNHLQGMKKSCKNIKDSIGNEGKERAAWLQKEINSKFLKSQLKSGEIISSSCDPYSIARLSHICDNIDNSFSRKALQLLLDDRDKEGGTLFKLKIGSRTSVDIIANHIEKYIRKSEADEHLVNILHIFIDNSPNQNLAEAQKVKSEMENILEIKFCKKWASHLLYDKKANDYFTELLICAIHNLDKKRVEEFADFLLSHIPKLSIPKLESEDVAAVIDSRIQNLADKIGVDISGIETRFGRKNTCRKERILCIYTGVHEKEKDIKQAGTQSNILDRSGRRKGRPSPWGIEPMQATSSVNCSKNEQKCMG